MSDGHEEREEREKRREWEREKRGGSKDDNRDDEDWVPERVDSRAANVAPAAGPIAHAFPASLLAGVSRGG